MYVYKHSGYVLSLLCLLAALQITMTAGINNKVGCTQKTAYALTASGATLTTLASLALGIVYAIETTKCTFDPPGDTYTATGLGVTVVLVPLLFIASLLFAKNRYTEGTSIVAALTLVLTIMGLITLSVWENNLLTNTPTQNCQQDANRVYSLLKRFDEVAKRNGIAYFISNDTLLGSMRNGGFTKWDSGIHIGMLESDLHTLYTDAVAEDLVSVGLHLEQCSTSTTCDGKIYDPDYGTPYITVTAFKDNGGDVLATTNPTESIHKTHLYGPDDQLKMDYVYGPLRLPGPYFGHDVIAKLYGKDAMTHFIAKPPLDGRRMLLRRLDGLKREMTPDDVDPMPWEEETSSSQENYE